MITCRNIYIHELIGLRVRVVSSFSEPYEGLGGIVVDETRNTLVVETGGRRLCIPKRPCVFEFVIPSGDRCRVRGVDILNRPENRPKRFRLGR